MKTFSGVPCGTSLVMMPTPPAWGAPLGPYLSVSLIDGAAVLAAAAYFVLAARCARTTGRRWPRHRSVCWVFAVGVIGVCVTGPVADYAEALFWVHMVQHLLLIMVAPLLLIVARPGALLTALGRRGCDGPGGQIGAGRVRRRATGPVVGLPLYMAAVVLTHLTGFQQLSATHPPIRDLELGLYLVSGILYLGPALGPRRPGRSLPYLLRFLLLGVGMGADTLVGLVLMLTSRPLVPAYSAGRDWGPAALADQQIAGAVMWFGGDLLMMLLMIAVAVRWGRATGDEQGLGSWLEGARRRSLLGGVADGDTGVETDVDSDERAWAAYNAALAALGSQVDRPGGRRSSGPKGGQ
jgi:putative copper resistance protein D